MGGEQTKMKFELFLNSFALMVLFCCIFIAFFKYDLFVTGLAIVAFIWCLSSVLNLLNEYIEERREVSGDD